MKGARKSVPLIQLGLVVTYAVAAFLLAHLVSGQRAGITADATLRPEPTDGQNLTLRIDLQASRPIAEWRISLDGAQLESSSRDALSWLTETSIEIREGSRLLLDLTPEDPATDAPLAVRIELNSDTGALSQTFWSPGDLVEVVSLEPLCIQPTESL